MQETKKKYLWEKVLAPDEKLLAEYTISSKLRKFTAITFGILGILTIFIFVGIIFLAIAAYWWFLSESKYSYGITNKRILLHEGIISSKLVSVKFEKITDVSVSQSITDKMFGVGSIKYNTAGGGSHEIIMQYIENPFEAKRNIEKIIDGAK
jgi:uncharacterized membrane protein YdbT with pleckstrin-like domain